MAARFVLNGFWLSGPSYKVGLMLSLAGETFDYVSINVRGGEQKTPEYLAKNPFAQVPCLEDREKGITVSQSAAILEYLSDTLKKFRAPNPQKRLQARSWMYWEFDRLAPNIFRSRVRRFGVRQFSFETTAMYYQEGLAALQFVDDQLKGKRWLVGSRPTIADIDLYGVVSFAPAGGFDLKPFKNIGKWMKRMEALPGFLPNDGLPKESRKA